MKQPVPLNKQSKRARRAYHAARRAYHAARRGSWYGLSPVTRVVPGRRGYDRNRTKRADRKIAAAEL